MKPIESFEVPVPPKVNYINAQYGLKSWLLTKDHKRIALLYLGSITFLLLHRRPLRNDDSPGVADAAGRFSPVDHLQQGLHPARHHNDLFLPDSVDTGDAGELPGADDDRGQRSGFSTNQSC